MQINISEILEKVIQMEASDLHAATGMPMHVRINTVLQPMQGYEEPLALTDMEYVLTQLMDDQQREIFEVN